MAARLAGCPYRSRGRNTTYYEEALINVQHPCVWALHLGRFDPLLNILGQKLGAPWNQQLSSGKIEHANAFHRRRLQLRSVSVSTARPVNIDRKVSTHKRSPFASWFFAAGHRPARRIRMDDVTPSLTNAMRIVWKKNVAINSAFLIHEVVSRDSTETRWTKRLLHTC